jgi:hypothetical protein
MNLRTRIAGGATALAMVGVFGLAAATPAGAASPTAQTTAVVAAPGVPVTGTLADGTPFVGQLSNLTTSVVNGALMLSGTVTGTGLPAMGTPFTTATVPAAAAANCQILNLNIQPINLDLLGLVVNLDAVHLDLTGAMGPGKLLGNLLCGLTGALAPGGLLAGLVSGLLNQVLPALGLGPVAPVV